MKPDVYISIDESGNPNDEGPFIISAVLIHDIDNFLKTYDISLKDAKELIGKDIKYFKWSEDPPKPSKLGKDIKGIFMRGVISNLRGISIIINKKGEKLSKNPTLPYGKIVGLKLREYVVGKKVFVMYDRSPILRGADKELIRINLPKWTMSTVVRVNFTGYDRSRLIHPADYASGVVREYVMRDEFKEEYRQFLVFYYEILRKNFRIETVNLADYIEK